jgi:hypothetical protein
MIYLTWRGARASGGDAVPGGYEPLDFALTAIEKLLDGRRPWNPQAYATIEDSLKAAIDSDISHLVESIDNIRGRRLAGPSSKCETARAYDVEATEPNPLKVVIDDDAMERFRTAAIKELGDDEFLKQLFECLEAEITEPVDIAYMLEITIDEVNNGKKRLRRKLDKLRGKFVPPQGRPRT